MNRLTSFLSKVFSWMWDAFNFLCAALMIVLMLILSFHGFYQEHTGILITHSILLALNFILGLLNYRRKYVIQLKRKNEYLHFSIEAFREVRKVIPLTEKDTIELVDKIILILEKEEEKK